MRRAHEAGFTLIEVMVIVVILALLALIAIPAFNRDTSKADYDRFMHQLAQDLQRAKFEAISSKENTRMAFGFTATYTLSSVAGGVSTVIRSNIAPVNVQLSGYKLNVQAAGNSAGMLTSALTLEFSPVSDVMVVPASPATPYSSSVTLYAQTADTKNRARIIIYAATGYTQRMEGW